VGKRAYGKRYARAFARARHPDGCRCAWDHCGERDSERATRALRRRDGGPVPRGDDARTWAVARSVGIATEQRPEPNR
jgi:hypothetical protein